MRLLSVPTVPNIHFFVLSHIYFPLGNKVICNADILKMENKDYDKHRLLITLCGDKNAHFLEIMKEAACDLEITTLKNNGQCIECGKMTAGRMTISPGSLQFSCYFCIDESQRNFMTPSCFMARSPLHGNLVTPQGVSVLYGDAEDIQKPQANPRYILFNNHHNAFNPLPK